MTTSVGTSGALRTIQVALTVAQISIGIAANNQTRRSVIRPASPSALAASASGTEIASHVAAYLSVRPRCRNVRTMPGIARTPTIPERDEDPPR